MNYKKIISVLVAVVLSFSIAAPSYVAAAGDKPKQQRGGGETMKLIFDILRDGNGKLTEAQFLTKIKAAYKANKKALGDMTEAQFVERAKSMFERFKSGNFGNRNSNKNGNGKPQGNNTKQGQSKNGESKTNKGTNTQTKATTKPTTTTKKPATAATKATAKKTSTNAKTTKPVVTAKVSVNTNTQLAKASDLNKYISHINRVKNLGIIYSKTSNTAAVSRQEFSKAMVIASGNEDAARSMKNAKNFSDVSAASNINLYISMAINKGFIAGIADGKFHPGDTVTFAQSCTAAVRALGYSDQDVSGVWPKNYIDKAKALGLTDDLNLSPSTGMPVWAIATIIDNLLDAKVKSNGQSDASKTFIDASGLSKDSYIFGHILNPVYSRPVIVNNFKVGSKKIGSIGLSGKKIVRNGELVSANAISDYDIVYDVTDKWKERSYILVVDDKVNGVLSNIIPNRISPKSISIDNKSYDISKDMNLTSIKTSSTVKAGSGITAFLGYDGKVINVLMGQFTDITIYDDPSTNGKLDSDEVLTDKGTYAVTKGISLSIGCKYEVFIDGTTIKKINKKTNNVKSYIVDKVVESSITATYGSKSSKLSLNDKIPYYYNGQKLTFDKVADTLSPYFSINFAYGSNGSNYDYAVITGPVYSAPTVVNGTTKIPQNKKIVRNGEYINSNQVLKTEVMYTTSDRNKKDSQISIVDNKVSGVLNKVLPNMKAPQTVVIGGKEYGVSRDFNVSSLNSANSKVKVGYNVTAILGYDGRVVDILYGQYGQVTVFGDYTSSDKASKGQLLTDKGVLYVSSDTSKFVVGSKYNVSTDGGKLVEVYEKANNTKALVVDNVVDTVVTVLDNGTSKTATLPEDITYYYDGQKVDYQNVYSSLQPYSTITFGYNDDNSNYEYGVISSPLFGKPMNTSTLVSSDNKIIKNGEAITSDKLLSTDILYKVSDISGKYSYILAEDNKVSGVLTGISPNAVNPKTLQISNKDYPISKDADISSIIRNTDALKLNGNITANLGYDGKILNIMGGQYTTVTVVGDYTTDSSLGVNQIQTDNGIYSVSGGISLKPGLKYNVVVDGNRITGLYNNMNAAKEVVVDSIVDSYAYTTDNGTKEKIDLPDKVTYYYGSKKLSSSDVVKVLKKYSTISFGYNSSKSDYDYAVISDPVYSKPAVVTGYVTGSNMIGNVDISNAAFIVKNGDIITADKIQNNDVIYSVTDKNGTKKYIQVVSDKVGGTITAILPDRISPTSIKIDDKEYAISRDFDLSKISVDGSILKVDNSATVVLGYDGKVVDVLNGYYVDCVVTGTSTTNSNLAAYQVMTDKGIFSLTAGTTLDYGYKYSVATSGTKITSIIAKLNNVQDVLVNSFNGTTVNSPSGTFALSDQIPYYYNGQKLSYSNLSTVIKQYSLITFGYNKDNSDYAYAVISDPVYGTPWVYGYTQYSYVDGSVPVIKNGVLSSAYAIQSMDVVYDVYDVRSRKTFVAVVSNKVTGTISSVLPDIMNPTSIQLGGKNYDVSKLTDKSMLFQYASAGVPVTLILGIHGEVIYIVPEPVITP